MSEEQRTGSWSTIKASLDVAATVAMIVAAGVLVWMVVRSPDASATSGPALPTAPVSIAAAPTLGSDTARVVLIAFSDFECPYCGEFATQVLPGLKAKYLDSGLVQLAFKHLPLTAIHPRAFRAAEAAECAAQQGEFWPLHDRLFEDVKRLGESDLRDHATSVGLDLRAFDVCMEGSAADRVRADVAVAESLGVRGTPTIMVGTRDETNAVRVQKLVPGEGSTEVLAAAVDELLEAESNER